jgi:hypothetical protein
MLLRPDARFARDKGIASHGVFDNHEARIRTLTAEEQFAPLSMPLPISASIGWGDPVSAIRG